MVVEFAVGVPGAFAVSGAVEPVAAPAGAGT